ncbi:acylphosphatase [Gloeophyllum trabeum ATCC 11539]|uniref:acylphosphatase n=1 Tax=Gloeophyllum trabeum (strain ATCC 11539 / FP-39264 / Madison 617) TaxID=670483 RepID=S7RR73_GLOTA|nr:acylphosphatase [Gloeophyllum trabeum ATCC 11539]EPQ57115.1 acylphosphatase [Gloeophyllum trabeum ATCC 11539]
MRYIEYLVRGRVQGVNFRAWTAKEAKQLNVTGYIQNTPEGHVAGAALGSDEDIEHFKKLLGKGPSIAQVTGVEIQKEETVEKPEDIKWGLKDFTVRR